MKRLSLIIAVMLAGCGGTDHGTTLPPVPPASELDVFFAKVSGVVASRPEDTDAQTVDALAPTTPDSSDPEPL